MTVVYVTQLLNSVKARYQHQHNVSLITTYWKINTWAKQNSPPIRSNELF